MHDILIRYRSIIAYGVFGVLTTAVNIVSYFVSYSVFGIPNVVSTALAWVLSVLFAFVTNKLWVFESKSLDRETVIREAIAFFACRAATGVLDIAIMFVAVDMMGWNALLWKLVSNALVIVLNFVASKLVIFKG
jgi:putative flippase GtrA